MNSDQEHYLFFLEKANLPGAFLWEQEIPPFPGTTSGCWYSLYCLFQDALRKRSERNAAHVQPGPPPDSLFDERPQHCERLIAISEDCKDGHSNDAFHQISQLVQELEMVPNRWNRHAASVDFDVQNENGMSQNEHVDSAFALADWHLAMIGSRMLRIVAFTHLETVKPAHIVAVSSDLTWLKKQNLSEPVFSWLAFQVDSVQAREFADFNRLIELAVLWNRYCEQWPYLGDGHACMADTLLFLELADQHEKAMQLVDFALQERPDAYDYLVIKTRLLKRQGSFQEAITISDKLVKQIPDDPTGYCLRSNANFLAGYYDKALLDAEYACQNFPDNPDSRMARAYILLHNGSYQNALYDFEKAAASEVYYQEALRGQGKCLSMLGRDLDALERFAHLRRQAPDDPDLHYEMADIYFAAGYLLESERACRRCLQLDPSYVSAYVILGMLALRRDRDDDARLLLTRAVEMEPDNPFALNELSYLKHLDGDHDTAFDLVNRAIQESPDYADAFCNKGTIHYYLGEFEEASASFGHAIALFPDHVNALVGRGNALLQLCEFESAQISFDQALAIEPESIEASYGKAMLFRMLGLEDEARQWQDKAWHLENNLSQNDEF